MQFDFSSLRQYDAIVDVRSPSEFASDHIPNAINMPALDDAQRKEVGTLYTQNSFEARLLGMGYMADNLSKMASSTLKDKDNTWRPLVYCWRGGMRSGSVVDVLCKVGWDASFIYGGYRSYRKYVHDYLETQTSKFKLIVLVGPTGSGKTLLLEELKQIGCQCLDLEKLANHRGSLFGSNGEQPSQKMFESNLVHELNKSNENESIFIESESTMIGRLRVPFKLIKNMRSAKTVELDSGIENRASFTANQYESFSDKKIFDEACNMLSRQISKKQIQEWKDLHSKKENVALAQSLLAVHYDPKYQKALERNFGSLEVIVKVAINPNDQKNVISVAKKLKSY